MRVLIHASLLEERDIFGGDDCFLGVRQLRVGGLYHLGSIATLAFESFALRGDFQFQLRPSLFKLLGSRAQHWEG